MCVWGLLMEVTQCREKNTCANNRASRGKRFRWQGDLTRHHCFHNVSSSSPIIVFDTVGSLECEAAHPAITHLAIEGEANTQLLKFYLAGKGSGLHLSDMDSTIRSPISSISDGHIQHAKGSLLICYKGAEANA